MPLEPERVLRWIEEATQSPDRSLGLDSDLTAVDGWDSMGMVMFIGLVTDQTGVDLAAQDFRTATTPRAIAQLIESRGAGPS
jgi:acyl carrier protein